MTVGVESAYIGDLYVPGAVPASGVLPVSDSTVVADDGDAGLLWQAAVAYQVGRGRLVAEAVRAARQGWMRRTPVDDGSAAEWDAWWDRLLGALARQQAGLTAAYVQRTAAAFGVPQGFARDVAGVVDAAEVDAASRWLGSPAAVSADPVRVARVVDAVGRARAGEGTVDDAAVIDRSRWVGSPVAKVRADLAAGVPLPSALGAAADAVEASTEALSRAVEDVIVQATAWPRFKNGTAMMFKRAVQSGACGWCRVVATRLYSAESGRRTARWHRSCHCTWVPVTRAEAEQYSGALRRSRGNYFEAAADVGLWSGPTDVDYKAVIAGNRGDGRPWGGRAEPAAGVSGGAKPTPKPGPAAGGFAGPSRDSMAHQLKVYREVFAAGGGTPWMRQRAAELEAELNKGIPSK